MDSTTSAWCRASRAAHEMASDGVLSADASRWWGRLVEGDATCTGKIFSTMKAMRPVSKMHTMATTVLNARWNSTTRVPTSGATARMYVCQGPIRGIISTTPTILNIRLPKGTWRVWTLAFSVVSTASKPLPRLAPITSPRATSTGIPPDAAKVATSSTVARLE